MIVLVNPRAGAHSARSRWKTVEPLMRSAYGEMHTVILSEPAKLHAAVLEAAQGNDPRIVAAGGDGTANAVVSAVLALEPALRSRCIVGAIGLGSSNDFHKPFVERSMIGGFPGRLAFDRAKTCDVGHIRYTLNGNTAEQFFFLNASAGITAEGNARFNRPGPVLKTLKRTNVAAAIAYAALTSLVAYRNQTVRLTIPGVRTLSVALTNLGILKSPYFSGELHYDAEMNYENGRFVVVACSSMNIPQRYALFRALKNGSLSGLDHVRTWSTPVVDLEAGSPIAIEFDGEVITAQTAHIEVQPHMLKVCP